MIKVQIANTVGGNELNESRLKANAGLETVRLENGKGNEWLGWRAILKTPNDALLEEIQHTADEIRSNADIFIVAGIGGSYLGARAVIDALTNSFGQDQEIIFAGNHMSERYTQRLLAYLHIRVENDGASVYLNVISKSGTTLETALSFRYVRSWMEKTYGREECAKRILCTTSESGGALNKLIEANNYRKFVLPDDIGGRFSVLSPVGLLPIAVSGVDIRSLFYGAVECYQWLENSPDAILDYVSNRLALYTKGYAIEALTVFEPHLKAFGEWYQQLFGESEGKDGKGVFPAVLSYSTDLHSVGQWVQEGTPTLMETFLIEENTRQPLLAPFDKGNEDGLNYLEGKSMFEINQKAFEGTRQAHLEGGVPVTTISVQEFDTQNMGRLIYFFELSCAVFCYAIGVNPFNQPGVEAYKKAMFKLLGKP